MAGAEGDLRTSILPALRSHGVNVGLSFQDTNRFIADFFFSSRRRHTRWPRDWSSDVCSSDLMGGRGGDRRVRRRSDRPLVRSVVAFPAPGAGEADRYPGGLADDGCGPGHRLPGVHHRVRLSHGCSSAPGAAGRASGGRSALPAGGSARRSPDGGAGSWVTSMGDVVVGAASYAGYVVAGYVIAVVGLGGYFSSLLYRARRARARARAIAAHRTG